MDSVSSPYTLSSSLVVPVAVGTGIVLVLLLFGRVPLSYNFYNLLARWRTTALAALAFTVVISLLVVMLAFVNGMYALTYGSGRPGNVVILAEGSTDESFSNLGFADIGAIENQQGILRDGSQPLVSRETFMILTQPLEAGPEPKSSARNLWGLLPQARRPTRRFLQLRGVDDPQISARVHGINLHAGGRWFSQSGVDEIAGQAASQTAIEVVVGEGIARQLARDKPGAATDATLQVGDTFALNERQWLVVGVMQSSGMTFDSEVWAKRSLIGPLFGKESYSALVARTADAAAAVQLKSYFNNEYKNSSVNALVETDYYTGLSETNKQFLYAIVFLTVVMAVGGVFGVMNTMYAAISQRTRDIGVLRLLGFNRLQVLTSFLTESVLIALVGGAIGCALGRFADGWTANSVVSGAQAGGKFVVLKLVVNADALATGMLLALAMGLVGGLLPSIQAVRVKILAALR